MCAMPTTADQNDAGTDPPHRSVSCVVDRDPQGSQTFCLIRNTGFWIRNNSLTLTISLETSTDIFRTGFSVFKFPEKAFKILGIEEESR
jgi:hypothetical protein